MRKILSIGAEARVSLEKTKQGMKVIKERVPKGYRIPAIDARLRTARTKRETKVLEKLTETGFVPRVLFSDNQYIIETAYLVGEKLANCLEKTEYKKIGKELGKKLKQIHNRGIIHGDLTTSNFILTGKGIFIVDFGLSFFSLKEEDKAVDLHVLEEALESKHHTISKDVFTAVKEGYSDPLVLTRLQHVETRGRNKKKFESTVYSALAIS